MKRIFVIGILLLLMTGCSNNSQTSTNGTAVEKGDYQEVTINISSNSYEDIVVQKDIPVKFNLKVTKENLNGCNNAILIKEWGIKKDLSVGDNIVEFTPTETGTFQYSCWMNMIRNKIKVVDDLFDD